MTVETRAGIKTIEIVFHVDILNGIKSLSTGANSLAKASAANALDKNPASVIPI